MPRETPERFASRGIRTGSPADALGPHQYMMLQNVRGYTPTELTTRPGSVLKFATENSPVQSIASYTDDSSPRYLAVVNQKLYLDDGTVIDTGYSTGNQSMVPFRPAQSPESWMYVADSGRYRKISSPQPTASPELVGIEEPQEAPTTALVTGESNFVFRGNTFNNHGAAGAVTNTTRTTDTVTAIFVDPNGFVETWQVSGTESYQRKMEIHFTSSMGAEVYTLLNDVFTPLPDGIAIAGIEYESGVTGRCVVVPVLQQPGPGNEEGLLTQQTIASLRRGALVKIGAEVCYVLDVESGPLGTVCFTTSTVANHTAAETLSGVPAVQIFTGLNSFAGMAIASFQWQFNNGAGVGTIDCTTFPAGSIFVSATGVPFQPDDYVIFGVNCEHLDKLIEIKLVFDVNNGPANFTENFYFYTVRPSDIQAGIDNTLTQLGVAQLYAQRQTIDEESKTHHHVASSKQTLPGDSQWSEIIIPIKEFIRVGNDESRTLLNMQGVQVIVNTSAGAVKFGFSDIFVYGQGQVDVGDVGVPVIYRVRGRSSVTGVRSNPSPATRYGWLPTRQKIYVVPPSVPDPQMDLWDIFRMGSTLDSFRLVGTIPTTSAAFLDNFSDISIAASEVLEFDNLQPWPTLDLPLTKATGVSVNGTIVKFSLTPGDPQLATIPRYLPGNIVRINQTAYTLRSRPTVVGTMVTMSLVENADVVASGALYIYEPLMAAQPLPYVWGPDAFGTIFAVGDENRPGTAYFAKPFNPDSAPDKYNVEVSAPSEPLVGGTLRGQESWCCSNNHWWALRPAFSGPDRYTPRLVEGLPGAVSHFAICPEAFVGRDGVYNFRGESLTPRETIYTLFTHEGAEGSDHVTVNATAYAPDYKHVERFRMNSANGFIYFDYPDTSGVMRHLIYDIHGKAWYVDEFSGPNMRLHYAVPQRDPLANTFVLTGDEQGNILLETLNHDDNGNPIDCIVQTRELCPSQWPYAWFENPGLDLQPTKSLPLIVAATSLGVQVGLATNFQGSSRITQGIVDIGGGMPLKSLGLLLVWTQTYSGGETLPAVLYLMEWVAVPFVPPILNQLTKGTSHGLRGFQHLYMGQLAYNATSPVTITLAFDQPGGQGTTATVVLPSTVLGPSPVKQQFKIPPNKFKIVSYRVESDAPWYLWNADSEFWLKRWGEDGEYRIVKPFGGDGENPIA